MSALDKSVMEFALVYPVDVRSVPLEGFDLALKADEKERCRLAADHGLLTVDEFLADFHLCPWKERGVRVQGHIKAMITQKCVITAEPVEKRINRFIDVVYMPRDSRLAKFPECENTQGLFLDVDELDAPEIFEGNKIDIGAIAEEFLELAIDPYPRKPGASFEMFADKPEGDRGKEEIRSPFSILEHLKML